MRDITIHAVLNGWIVTVKCQTVVFNDLNIMLEELEQYFLDPIKREKWYRDRAINAKHILVNGEAPIDPLLRQPDPVQWRAYGQSTQTVSHPQS